MNFILKSGYLILIVCFRIRYRIKSPDPLVSFCIHQSIYVMITFLSDFKFFILFKFSDLKERKIFVLGLLRHAKPV
jgi:hypothetical protein